MLTMRQAIEILSKPTAVLLFLTGAAVLGHFVFGTFYRNVVEAEDIWYVLNWFMAFGMIVALLTSHAVKRASCAADTDAKTYIGGNAFFYATAAVTILFFWNWFNELTVGGGNEGTVNLNFWTVIDTLFPLIVGSTAVRLWRYAPSA